MHFQYLRYDLSYLTLRVRKDRTIKYLRAVRSYTISLRNITSRIFLRYILIDQKKKVFPVKCSIEDENMKIKIIFEVSVPFEALDATNNPKEAKCLCCLERNSSFLEFTPV